jgi:anti-sigma factor RsiW
MTPERNEDLAALLPWYLNGTLDEAERARVEGWLRAAPERDAELAMWRAVQADARIALPVPAFDEVGWRRLRTQLPGVRRNSWLKVAAAASVLLIAGLQTAILVRDDAGVHRPLSETPLADHWQLRVRFADSATLAEIGAMLERHDAQVVAGPSALGLYTLAIPKHLAPSSPQTLVEALQAEPLIVEVTVAP